MQKVIVFGQNGWIGKQLIKLLIPHFEIINSNCKADDMNSVNELIEKHTPSHILCVIGRTHGHSCQTIDYLESPETLKENVRDNLFAPVLLALLCKKHKIHLTYIGTGCIFNSLPDGNHKVYEENDVPDFFGSNYSIVKGMTDQLMHVLDDMVLNVRIRMPITEENHPRNFISKIVSYCRICSIPNSMSVLPTLLPCVVQLMREKFTGTINLTNPGLISHDEILTLYKELVDPEFKWENFDINEQDKILKAKRSNNELSSVLLRKLFPDVPDIRTAIRDCLIAWKKE
jgi:dTDP-4-dehydrorhamnose reductase